MKRAAIAFIVVLAAFSTVAQDSPLVAAAKANAKTKKKKATTVITNDNLVKTGGHVTTTTNTAPLPPVNMAGTVPPEEIANARRREAERVRIANDKAKQEAEKKQKTEERKAAIAEGDYDGPPLLDPNDPNLTPEQKALVEKSMTKEERDMYSKMAQEAQGKKPPL